MTVRLSSDDIRCKISEAVGLCVKENSCPDGNMSFVRKLSNGNSYTVQVGIVEFLSAYYGVSEFCIRLAWNVYSCAYSAVVAIEDKGGSK